LLFQDAKPELERAKGIYNELSAVYQSTQNPGLAALFRQFSVSVALAMIAHTEWRFLGSTSSVDALRYWKDALIINNKVHKNPDKKFAEMMILLSTSDINGDKVTSEKVRSIYAKSGRQFYYIGLGSVWFDLIQEGKNDSISRLRYQDYIKRQTESGFPVRGKRLCI
jgi:hypothetical protein